MDYNAVIQQYQQRLADATLEAVTSKVEAETLRAELARAQAEVRELQTQLQSPAEVPAEPEPLKEAGTTFPEA